MQNEAYQKLMDNLCDIVAEEQAKLGYMKEPIRLYYPLSSLNQFFGGDVSADEMQEKLSKCEAGTQGKVTVKIASGSSYQEKTFSVTFGKKQN